MQISLKTLQVFLAVAETGSFRKTAELVHRSQSAVSMQVKLWKSRSACSSSIARRGTSA